MIRYYDLRRNERAFKSVTGVTVAEFKQLYAKFEPAWMAAEQRRLQRAGRQRAIGGGSLYRLGVEDQLLMVLVWLRIYPSTATLGYLFGVSQPTASRNSRRVLQVLKAVSMDEFEWPDPPQKGQGRGLLELQQAYPDAFAIIDATEQPVERPQDREKEKQYFSGKRRRPTCKSSIVVNEHGVIRGITESSPGRTHDLTQIRQSGLLAHISTKVTVVADSAYQGLDKYMPTHSVDTIPRAQRNHPLPPEEKARRRRLSAIRIVVERTIAHLKNFNLLDHRFRHDVEAVHTDAFAVIAAIVNSRTIRRLASVNVA
jgi:hypothetical protein